MALAATAVTATTVSFPGLSEFVQHGRLRPEALFRQVFEGSEADV
jgi:hypothetical protein